ncbi:MAG: 6-phosphofructokinase [Armatimonadetes bacterium]|nr:6-phosphofructokinase [Armatimonadota bacterium]
MKRIGVLCSGGDSPGMNACVRAVVRTGLGLGLEVFGVERGYTGLVNGVVRPLVSHDVSGIINHGGTIVRTARCPEFREAEGRARAAEHCRRLGIEGLVVCGGDGSFAGGRQFWHEHGIGIAGTPGTIDNDLAGTDFTIGFDTAVNTAVEACDKIRDTADSHDRVFVVEVMGRASGSIALQVAVAAGAEVVLLPERPQVGPEQVAALMAQARALGKTSMLVIVAEGAGTGQGVAHAIELATSGLSVRASVLGYIQRGGSPTSNDRVLATMTGAGAVHALVDLGPACCHHIGVVTGAVTRTPLDDVVGRPKPLPADLLELVDVSSGLRLPSLA